MIILSSGVFNFVLPRIATGGEIVMPESAKALVVAGITHVINCAMDADDGPMLSKMPLVCFYNATTDDDGQTTQPAEWFEKTLAFALPVLAQPRTKVYAHCRMGINRGPSACYSILRALGHSPQVAESLIRAARPEVGLKYMRSAEEALAVLGYV